MAPNTEPPGGASPDAAQIAAAPAPTLFAGSAAYAAQAAGARPVLTIGNFDGVHRGHQRLLDAVVSTARARGVPAAVYTFDPPPRAVLAPAHAQPQLTDWPERARLLGASGVQHVIIERFSRAFAQHTPEWFAQEVLGRRVNPSEIVVGYDFRFGKARAGNLELLQRLLPSVPVSAIQAFEAEGAIVSSSRLRALVAAGDVAEAARLLGRPYALRGTVVSGDRRGRTLGFPTANVESGAELLPPKGVYAVWASVNGGAPQPAVANLGVRPTFGGEGRFLVEVHLLDFSGQLYGHELGVSFVARLRPEQRFDGLDALRAQISLDTAAARRALALS